MPKFLFLIFTLFILSSPLAIAGDYIIGDGDSLVVSVWNEPELSGEVIVRPDGKITLPAIGDVVATGRTPSQLAGEIENALQSVLKEPIVTLRVAMVTNNNIYVAGGGVPSEVVALPGRITLFKFLCRFGSMEEADLARSYVMRGNEKVKEGFYSLFVEGDFSQDIELMPNDIVFIPNYRDNKIYIVGAVMEPQFIFYTHGMKVLDAILQAGGFTEYADQSEVVVIRKAEGSSQTNKDVEIEVNIKKLLAGKDPSQNILLQPGDYVTVNEGLF
jgi:polysaccharide export outer membrane protein